MAPRDRPRSPEATRGHPSITPEQMGLGSAMMEVFGGDLMDAMAGARAGPTHAVPTIHSPRAPSLLVGAASPCALAIILINEPTGRTDPRYIGREAVREDPMSETRHAGGPEDSARPRRSPAVRGCRRAAGGHATPARSST